jgi:hypothetical protein
LVKVRNARGRSVAGGRATGRIVALASCIFRFARQIEWTGLPKAGDEDGITLNELESPVVEIMVLPAIQEA